MDPARAAEIREGSLPPTASLLPLTAVVDLGGAQITPAALRELIVSVGQRLRGGVYGNLKIIIASADKAIAESVTLLAREYDLPLYLATSSRTEDIENAEAVGNLQPAEFEALENLRAIGGGATAAGLAGATGVSASSISNKLLNLERKGYLFRLERSRRDGDIYVDPRIAAPDVALAAARGDDTPPPRDALLRRGIRSNPYDRVTVVVDGDAGERLEAAVRRRGKIT
jgi:hypothetical protein